MPIFSGTSISELQSLGTYVQGANPFVALDFPQFDLVDFKLRIGLLLVCQVIPDGSPRVIDVRKVFAGTGILLIPAITSPIQINVLVDWYRTGVVWSLQTA